MKIFKILSLALMAMIFFSGCSNKERAIPKTSPCSCYDMIIKVG